MEEGGGVGGHVRLAWKSSEVGSRLDSQVKQWKGHKALCEVISQNKKDDEIKNEEFKKSQAAQ